MFVCQGKLCRIEELTSESENLLFELLHLNQCEYRHFVCDEVIPHTQELFSSLLHKYFSSGREYQFLVFDIHNDVIGTVFFSWLNNKSRSVKMSCFFIPSIRGNRVVGEALACCANFAREVMNVEEICFSVYQENLHMLRLAEKIGAEVDGLATSVANENRRVVQFILKGTTIETLVSLIIRKD